MDHDTIPEGATPEELERWWLLRAAFYLRGSKKFSESWSTLFPDEDEAKRQAYVEAMNIAYASLPDLDRKILALRQIADAADAIPIAKLQETLGMPLPEIVAREQEVQLQLRVTGSALWGRLN